MKVFLCYQLKFIYILESGREIRRREELLLTTSWKRGENMQNSPNKSTMQSDTIQISQKDIDVFKVRLVGADRIHARDAILTREEELILKDLKRKLKHPHRKTKRIKNYNANASRLFDNGFIITDRYSEKWVISQEGLRYLRCRVEEKHHKYINYTLSIIAIIISCVAIALEISDRTTAANPPAAIYDTQETTNDSIIP